MMTLRSAQQATKTALSGIYDVREAAAVTDWLFEHLTGRKKLDRLLVIDEPLPAATETRLAAAMQQLLQHIPIQYVLEQAWFCGMPFYVNPHVLVPRPETEELVTWIADTTPSQTASAILDIGTGSGCIPVTLKKKLPAASITAVDLSADALIVAKKNATALAADVHFLQMDFLDQTNWSSLGVFDVIVSNPPYIRQSEAAAMHRNVTDHEPHMALFVPDEDPLVFYRCTLGFAEGHLRENGSIFFELNEALGKETADLCLQAGYRCELRKDMQGKDRMLRVYR